MIDYRDHDRTQAECLESAERCEEWAEYYNRPETAEFARRYRRRAEDWQSRAAWAKDVANAE